MGTQRKSISDRGTSALGRAAIFPQAVYCPQHELKLSTFTYWRNKQSNHRPKLMPVPMPALEASVELPLPGDIQMQLPVSALGQALPPLWRLLREQR